MKKGRLRGTLFLTKTRQKYQMQTAVKLPIDCRSATRAASICADSPELLRAVATTELVNLSCSVHNLLLAGVKWMASRADLDTEILARS